MWVLSVLLLVYKGAELFLSVEYRSEEIYEWQNADKTDPVSAGVVVFD